jgi:hypothetical protein
MSLFAGTYDFDAFGTIRLQFQAPQCFSITDRSVLLAELAVVRSHYNGVRLHAGIGYVRPAASTRDEAKPCARPGRPGRKRPGSYHRFRRYRGLGHHLLTRPPPHATSPYCPLATGSIAGRRR